MSLSKTPALLSHTDTYLWNRCYVPKEYSLLQWLDLGCPHHHLGFEQTLNKLSTCCLPIFKFYRSRVTMIFSSGEENKNYFLPAGSITVQEIDLVKCEESKWKSLNCDTGHSLGVTRIPQTWSSSLVSYLCGLLLNLKDIMIYIH